MNPKLIEVNKLLEDAEHFITVSRNYLDLAEWQLKNNESAKEELEQSDRFLQDAKNFRIKANKLIGEVAQEILNVYSTGS